MYGKSSVARDVAAGIVVVVALAMRFVPTLPDSAAHMQVHFRFGDMGRPHAFTTETSKSVCTTMAATLSYEDPGTGQYTRVACGE